MKTKLPIGFTCYGDFIDANGNVKTNNMEAIIGRCPRHPSQSFINCPLCDAAELSNWAKDIAVDSPSLKYQRLADAIYATKGIALQSEMDYIIKIVNEDFAEWNKIEYPEDYPPKNLGVLVFIPDEDNHITAGMWDVDNKWVLLDEYRVPECKITHWRHLPKKPNE